MQKLRRKFSPRNRKVKKLKIAFQGTKGAYSEEALINYFKNQSHEAIGIALSEDVCEALESNLVDYAILPVENSIVGNVDINMDLIFKYNFHAVGEIFIPIKHCLLGKKGSKLSDIKSAHSHPVALAQCHDFLKKNHIKSIAEYDTAGSAKIISQNLDNTQGAIGSKLCAKYYDLEVVCENVQTIQRNITRFLIFKKEAQKLSSASNIKTSIAFCTKHHPGALLGCLGEFAKFHLNLTKLESRPVPENPFMYIFFVDFIGSLKEVNVMECLKELENHATDIKIIGSYPSGVLPDSHE